MVFPNFIWHFVTDVAQPVELTNSDFVSNAITSVELKDYVIPLSVLWPSIPLHPCLGVPGLDPLLLDHLGVTTLDLLLQNHLGLTAFCEVLGQMSPCRHCHCSAVGALLESVKGNYLFLFTFVY